MPLETPSRHGRAGCKWAVALRTAFFFLFSRLLLFRDGVRIRCGSRSRFRTSRTRPGTTGEIRVPLSGRLACSPRTLMLGDRPDQTLIGSHSAARKMRHASTPATLAKRPQGPRGLGAPLFPLRSCASVERKGVVGVCLAQRLACSMLTDNTHRAHTHSLTHPLTRSLTHARTHRHVKHVAGALR